MSAEKRCCRLRRRRLRFQRHGPRRDSPARAFIVPIEAHPKHYRGRIAPSPTGLLHIGHARTFWVAAKCAAEQDGTLILRNEDLDQQRCRPEFVDAMMEDLRWLGISWQEGPDCGGPVGPYTQSERMSHYLAAWKQLRKSGAIYPCTCSRKDVALSAGAPNEGDDEPLYSGKCRPKHPAMEKPSSPEDTDNPAGLNWRFRVPDDEAISFNDQHLGPQQYVA